MTFETVSIGDIADVTKLAGFEFTKYIEYNETGEIIALRALNLRNGTLDLTDIKRIDRSVSEKLPRSKLYINDILLTYTGNGYGDCAIVEENDRYHLAPNICKIAPNPEKINPYFLYSVIRSSYFYQQMKNYIGGSSQPTIPMKTIRVLQVPYPPIQTQNQIASILHGINSKIAINTAINENLEQQAQAFFIELFITNAKFKWKTGTISDLGNVIGGGTPSKKVEEYYTNDGIAWITPKDLSNDKSKFITHGETDITDVGLAKSSATLMPRGAVLFSSRAPIGYIAIADGQVSTNQGFKSIVPFDNVGTAYIYYFLKENLSAIENVASGSTFKEVSGSTMKNFPAVIPDDDTLAEFKQFCIPIFEHQRALEYENRYLVSIRDTLLPKLMNGEIDVSAVKI